MLSDISDSCKRKRITVCTPTYNRAYILANLYHSLLRQSFTDFEWLVVDDGSTDETEVLLKKWQSEEKNFSLRYYKKQNGGKHRAVNDGLTLSEGEIFFVVDSDDYLTDDALEKLDFWFKEIQYDKTIVSIAANKGASLYETRNELFEEPYLDKTFLDMGIYRERGKLVLNGERAIAFYTDFHKKYLYPEFEGEKFLTEAVVYNRMARDGYKTRFYNDIIWIFQYREDGLSSKGSDIYIENPRGYGLWFKERAEFLHYSWYRKMRMYYSFYCDLRNIYPASVIAESIGASVLELRICQIMFRIRHGRR